MLKTKEPLVVRSPICNVPPKKVSPEPEKLPANVSGLAEALVTVRLVKTVTVAAIVSPLLVANCVIEAPAGPLFMVSEPPLSTMV